MKNKEGYTCLNCENYELCMAQCILKDGIYSASHCDQFSLREILSTEQQTELCEKKVKEMCEAFAVEIAPAFQEILRAVASFIHEAKEKGFFDLMINVVSEYQKITSTHEKKG